MSTFFSGTGIGAQTSDGCSVELYRRLPYMGELGDVQGLLTKTESVLELGCGTGRLCAVLAGMGLKVTGVDESADMLRHVPSIAQTVHASIETLRLATQFDTVLLASYLINHPDDHTRRAFVQCARRHVKRSGRFLVQRHNPAWLETVQSGYSSQADGIVLCVEQVSREHGVVSMTLLYTHAGDSWRHSFSTLALTEMQVEALLRDGGFTDIRWHGSRKLWASAMGIDD
jgi:SAM-dependent methyltransferase